MEFSLTQLEFRNTFNDSTGRSSWLRFLIPVGRKWERNWIIECFLKSAIVKRQAIRYNRFRQIKKETHNSEFLNPHLCGPRRAVWKVLYLNLVVLSHMVVN